MTTPHRTLLQQALDALEAEGHPGWRLLTALREALAAPEPEPVAEVYRARYGRRARYIGVNDVRKLDGVALPPLGTKLYAATPAAPEPSVDDMPGMWEPSDTFGGEADSAAPPAAPDHLRDVAEKVAPAAPVVPDLKHCACEFDGDACVTQCKLHAAHVDAIHEWAERAKAAEAKLLAAPVVREPLTEEQIRSMWRSSKFRGNGGQADWFCEGMRAAEAHHGITGASK